MSWFLAAEDVISLGLKILGTPVVTFFPSFIMGLPY